MGKALDFLLRKEWSMGNGQCPECCGVPEAWFPHPLHCTPDALGHEVSCKLAAAIKESGGEPLYKGQSKLLGNFRFGLRDVPPGQENSLASCFTMIPAEEPPSKREIELRNDWQKIMQKSAKKILDKYMQDDA